MCLATLTLELQNVIRYLSLFIVSRLVSHLISPYQPISLWQHAEVTPYQIPLSTPLMLGKQRLSMREGLYLKLTFTDGHEGLGEIAPLPGFSRESLNQAYGELIGWLKDSATPIRCPSVAWGIDCAQAQPPTFKATADYPLLQGDISAITAKLEGWPKPLTLAKLKVAREALDVETHKVQQILRQWPSLRLRLDANRGWTLTLATEFARHIDLSRIDYVEQPCQSWQACAELSSQTGCPVALDESLQEPNYQFENFSGLRALVLKPTLMGSKDRLLSLIHAAQAAGVSQVVSSSYESELGLAHLQQFAATFTNSQPGLDTHSIFADKPKRMATQRFTRPRYS
jgi:O-succinylbenzoate synthase